MTVYKYKRGQRLPIGSCAVAIGFFDGVHLAHRELILSAVEEAKKRGIASGVVTFASESSIKSKTPRLYSTEDRLAIMESLGVDFAVLCDFSEISGLSGEEFVRHTIAGDIGAVCATAGYNFRFGKGASSGADDLIRYMRECRGDAVIKEPYLYNGAPLSSTVIRALLTDGEVQTARELLALPYFVSGEVTHGRGVGRGLGFPTINLDHTEGRVKLKHGVYRCVALIAGKLYDAVTNVGVCPTFEKRSTHIEAHLINFDKSVYGEKMRLYFLGYLREEKKFASAEELTAQIKLDKERAIKENGEEKWQEIGLSLR